MERVKTSTKCGGVDVGKRRLEGAVHGQAGTIAVDNTAEGIAELIAWFGAQGVRRVGLEASGGYEQSLAAALAAKGFEVVIHQPIEVRLFARLRRRRAKNDALDAHLIAAATAQVEAVKAAQDPRLQELAQRLTAYEQACDLHSQMKVCLEHVGLPDLAATWKASLAEIRRLKDKLAEAVLKLIRSHPDLERRWTLLMSLPGVGRIIAASLLVRMPELGSLKHGQAAALAGVAPFDRDSGQWRGRRFIAGGRSRPRRMLFLAAWTAKRCDPAFGGLAKSMLANGKPAKVVLVALMRRLVEAANLVLARGEPWVTHASA